MRQTLSFTGFVSSTVFSEAYIANGTPADSTNAIRQNNGEIRPVNINDQPIQWLKNVPPSLEGATVNTLEGDNTTNKTITQIFDFEITSGNQYSSNTGNPNINVTL